MTELDTIPQAPAAAPAVPVLSSGAMSLIREYTAAMDDAHRFASAICVSPFVPSHFRNKPADTALAILYGASVGFDPMTSVQQLFVIGGKPALYARAMVAVALAAGHEIWTEEERPGFVTVAGKRAGSDKVTRVTWTSELAQQAGYTSNPKYKSDPRSMLYARASGDVARRIAPDALLGLAYNVEEMQLVETMQRPQTEQATASAKDRVRAAIASPQTPDSAGASADPAPEAPPAAPPAESEDTVPTITSAQSNKLHATYNDLGITERPDRLAYATRVLGREVSTSKEITKDEATRLIESAAADLAARTAAGEAVLPDEDGVVEGEVVDEQPDERGALWDACTARAAELGMNLWTLPQDFEATAGVAHADATADLLRTYLEDLNGREVTR